MRRIKSVKSNFAMVLSADGLFAEMEVPIPWPAFISRPYTTDSGEMKLRQYRLVDSTHVFGMDRPNYKEII